MEISTPCLCARAASTLVSFAISLFARLRVGLGLLLDPLAGAGACAALSRATRASIFWRLEVINADTSVCNCVLASCNLSSKGILSKSVVTSVDGAASIMRPVVPARMWVDADELEGELLLEQAPKL